MGEHSIRNPEAVRDALRQLCERGELLILVTPYLRFESSFLRIDENSVHVTASMSREDAQFGLKSPELKMRFPYAFTFLEGATSVLGMGIVRGRPSLRLSVPGTLEDDDHRGAYRADRVGRVPVTFSTRKYDLLTGNLVNISTTGARIFSARDFEEEDVQIENQVMVTIPIEPHIHINCKCVVRYVQGRSMGVEFKPRLESPLLDNLSRWIFKKREEDRSRSVRADIAPGGEARASGPGAPLEGVILVSLVPALEDRLRELLAELPTLHRIPPSTQAFKDLGPMTRCLLLIHVGSLGIDERKRLRALAEPLAGRAPFVLLGTDVDSGALQQLGNELKAAASYVLGPNPGTFFPRLLQGIMRRHFEGGEGPLAPSGPKP
jgi:hypothetical protein